MRKLFSLITTLILIIGLAPPVLADAVKIGNKTILEGGYEATVIGFTDESKPIYQANFGIPKYLPDLKTLYNTSWSDKGTEFQSGENLFTSSVQNTMVSIQDKKGNSMTWQPTITVGNLEKAKDKSGVTAGIQTPTNNKPKVLAVDPINSNYKNNTLEWDYGNGLVRRLRIIEGMVQEYYVVSKEIGGDLDIKANVGKSANYKSDRVAYAYDVERNPIELTLDADHNVKLTKDKSLDPKIKYPITIDPDSTFIASASDGWIAKTSVVSFADARTAAWGSGFNTAGIGLSSSYQSSPIWWIYRGFVLFNTSALDGYVVSAATMSLYSVYKATTDGYSVQIQEGINSSIPNDPPANWDYNLTGLTGNGGTIALAAWVTTGYNVFTITDLGMINQTGTTKLALRMTGDINNTAPTGQNEIACYSYEQGTGFQPYLTVTYTALTPGVTSQPASNVAKTSARLNAVITGDGGADCEVSWGYGTTSHVAGDFNLYDTVTAFSGAYRVGDTPYLDLTGLTANTPYFFRIQVKNALSTVTSVTEQTFTTSATVSSPVDSSTFYGIPSSTSIDLSWVLPTGSTQGLLRYRTDTYPTSTTNGNKLYEGAATTYEHTETTPGSGVALTPGKTYYYSLWGESGGSYSATAANLVVTTKGTDPGVGGNPTSPDLWSQFFQEVGPTLLSNLEPLPALVGIFASGWGMPVDNTWFLMTIGIIALITIGILITTKSVLGAFGFAIVALFVSALLKTSPGWMILVTVAAGLGAVALWKMRPQGG